MTTDLRDLLPLHSPWTALDWFMGSCLTEGGVWNHPRTSDGISGVTVFEHIATRVCLWGRIWTIHDQTEHTFWLEITSEGIHDRFRWFLFFDAPKRSGPQKPRALDHVDAASEIEWRASVEGEAEARNDQLDVVRSSTRSAIRDPSNDPC